MLGNSLGLSIGVQLGNELGPKLGSPLGHELGGAGPSCLMFSLFSLTLDDLVEPRLPFFDDCFELIDVLNMDMLPLFATS